MKIEFCVVPAHVEFEGNEEVDMTAKEASISQNICNIKIQYNDFRYDIGPQKYCMD